MLGRLVVMSTNFTFPVGYHDFHKKKGYNFQFNRYYSWGYARYIDMVEVASRINSFSDWSVEWLKLAQQAEREYRLVNAAYYYRAAEFYLLPEDPDKTKVYNKFVSIIRDIMKADGFEFIEVPYKNVYLPCLRLKANCNNSKGTIVMHGGFDSFKEEFYSTMKYFSDKGYEVIVFEGPGQGEARKKYELAFDYQWEKPTTAVLDYFKANDVTLVGISFGGYLCFRAAAFESRIKRVIASSIAYDYPDFNPKIIQPLIKLYINKFRGFANRAFLKDLKKGDQKSWWMSNFMYMTKKEQPIDVIHVMAGLTADKLYCDRITQDILILTGRDDHYVPFKMHKKQVDALANAKSVTDKVFYEDTYASNHCQVGNMELNLNTMIDWIESLQYKLYNDHVKQ